MLMSISLTREMDKLSNDNVTCMIYIPKNRNLKIKILLIRDLSPKLTILEKKIIP